MAPVHLGPSHQGKTKADVVVLEVSMVSDNEPRVGEKHDQGQGQGDQAENMKKAGRRIRRSAAIRHPAAVDPGCDHAQHPAVVSER